MEVRIYLKTERSGEYFVIPTIMEPRSFFSNRHHINTNAVDNPPAGGSTFIGKSSHLATKN